MLTIVCTLPNYAEPERELVNFITTFFIEIPVLSASSVDRAQIFVASDLGLYCLPVSLLWNARNK